MLHVHRSDRADALADALRGLLADPLPDPFAQEIVSVPTRGIERWLTQRMSAGLGTSPGRADGVCANVDFPPPGRLIADAVATASGIDPDADPWRAERAVWALLEIVDASLGEPWLAPLANHLGDTSDETRRARRLHEHPPHRRAVRPLRAVPAGDVARGGPPARKAAGRPSSGAACARGCPCPARPSAAARRAALCARTQRSWSCRRGSRCSGSRACLPATSTCCARSPRTATCTCSCCTRRPRCGSGCATTRPSCAVATSSGSRRTRC